MEEGVIEGRGGGVDGGGGGGGSNPTVPGSQLFSVQPAAGSGNYSWSCLALLPPQTGAERASERATDTAREEVVSRVNCHQH